MLYTGITRAKELLVLISQDNVIEGMIQNSDTKKRNTGLTEQLKGFN